MSKHTRITIETDRVLVITHQVGTSVWCVNAGKQTQIVSLEEPSWGPETPARVRGTEPLKSNKEGWRARIGESVRRFLRSGFVG